MPLPPNFPGGRLMWWMTRSSIAAPTGRSSQFGEGMKRAMPGRPSGETEPGERVCPCPLFLVPRPFTASALGVQLFLDPEPLHAVAQRAKGDAEHLGCRGAVVARLLQRVEDGLALHGVELLGQRPAGQGGGRRGGADARGSNLEI